jgi:sarcosine oxidase gamma subunit
MRRVVFVLLAAVGAAGCATMGADATRSTEQMLAAAGFHSAAADTPEKVAHLRTLTPRRIVARVSNGQTFYLWPDPDVCTCLYVGGESEYQQYRKLARQRDIADEELRVETSDGWTPGLWWR